MVNNLKSILDQFQGQPTNIIIYGLAGAIKQFTNTIVCDSGDYYTLGDYEENVWISKEDATRYEANLIMPQVHIWGKSGEVIIETS